MHTLRNSCKDIITDVAYTRMSFKIAAFRQAGMLDPKFQNIQYYTSRFPYVILTIPLVNIDDYLSEVRQWCQDTFGDNWIWSQDIFVFIYEKDATLFALRWVK